MNPRALLFDLDDTLVSFSTGQERLWLDILNKHTELFHAPGADRDVLHLVRVLDETVGPAYWADADRAVRGRLELYRARREVLTLALAELGWDLPLERVNQIADAYTDAKENAVAPLGDSLMVVTELARRGYRLGLITNGGSEFQRRKLKRYQLERCFEVVLVEGEWGVGKPHPSVFREALRCLDVAPGDVWMIGDNFEADMRGAASVGIGGVWLHHGRAVPASEVTPLHCISHVRELLGLLE